MQATPPPLPKAARKGGFKPLYAAILLVSLLVGAGLTLAFCSTGDAPPDFDPTRY